MQNNAAENNEKQRVYAGFFVRLSAYLVDWFITGLALLLVRVPIWIASFSGTGSFFTNDLIFSYSLSDILLYLCRVSYYVLLTYYTGATLGKKLFHLEVVSAEDRKPTFFEIVYRESVGKFLSGVILGIGFLMIGPDQKKRGLHDRLADTSVIYCHRKVVYVAAPYVTKQVPYISTQLSSNPGPEKTEMDASYWKQESQDVSGEYLQNTGSGQKEDRQEEDRRSML